MLSFTASLHISSETLQSRARSCHLLKELDHVALDKKDSVLDFGFHVHALYQLLLAFVHVVDALC